MLPLLESEVKERELSNLKRGTETPVVEIFPEREKLDSRDQAAALVGVSGKYVSDMKAIEQKATPEQKADLSAGKATTYIDEGLARKTA